MAGDEGVLVLVAVDVLAQATSNRRLKRLLDAASTWEEERSTMVDREMLLPYRSRDRQ